MASDVHRVPGRTVARQLCALLRVLGALHVALYRQTWRDGLGGIAHICMNFTILHKHLHAHRLRAARTHGARVAAPARADIGGTVREARARAAHGRA